MEIPLSDNEGPRGQRFESHGEQRGVPEPEKVVEAEHEVSLGTTGPRNKGRNSIAIPSFRIILRITVRIAIELKQF